MITRSDSERRRLAEESRSRLRPALAVEAQQCLDPDAAVAFLARLDLWFVDVHGPLAALYGEAEPDVDGLVERAAAARPAGRGRTAGGAARAGPAPGGRPGLVPDQRMSATSPTSTGSPARWPGCPAGWTTWPSWACTYLHLMPLLEPREGANDGGYAVRDYRAVDPRLGTMDELAELAGALRERGMSLCIDLVLNHTAREHPWARGWLAGDPRVRRVLHGVPRPHDARRATRPRSTTSSRERRPGSFSWVPGGGGAGGWVWTTFFDYQWDLNYTNPKVFAAMLDTILWLANRGVEIFRLDAVPFMWKRLGTNCINQPEVHLLVQALHALVKLAAPAVVFKAEAIVAPDDLVPYLGGHDRYRPECELAYHNQLMVMLWSSLATKDARLATQSLRRMRPIPADDVVGHLRALPRRHRLGGQRPGRPGGRLRPFAHRDFLNAFFSGRFPLSFARGALFGENPETGDARISGSAAALCGIADGRARGDDARAGAGHPPARAAARGDLRLGRRAADLHGRRAGPGQRRDATSTTRRWPADNRWMHRPWFDEAAAARRHDPDTVEGRVFGWLVALAAARRELPALHAAAGDRGAGRRLAARAGLAPAASAQRLVRRAGQLRRASGVDRGSGARPVRRAWRRCCPVTGC